MSPWWPHVGGRQELHREGFAELLAERGVELLQSWYTFRRFHNGAVNWSCNKLQVLESGTKNSAGGNQQVRQHLWRKWAGIILCQDHFQSEEGSRLELSVVHSPHRCGLTHWVPPPLCFIWNWVVANPGAKVAWVVNGTELEHEERVRWIPSF